MMVFVVLLVFLEMDFGLICSFMEKRIKEGVNTKMVNNEKVENTTLSTNVIISKTEKAIKAQLDDFSEDTIKKIQSKQKEIFDTKCSAKLIEFKNLFKGIF